MSDSFLSNPTITSRPKGLGPLTFTLIPYFLMARDSISNGEMNQASPSSRTRTFFTWLTIGGVLEVIVEWDARLTAPCKSENWPVKASDRPGGDPRPFPTSRHVASMLQIKLARSGNGTSERHIRAAVPALSRYVLFRGGRAQYSTVQQQ
jgi:hypothetical protein